MERRLQGEAARSLSLGAERWEEWTAEEADGAVGPAGQDQREEAVCMCIPHP